MTIDERKTLASAYYRALILYYWLLAIFYTETGEAGGFTGMYFLYIVPVLAFFTANLALFLDKTQRTTSLYLFLCCAVLVAASRRDMSSILYVGMMVSFLIFAFKTPFVVPVGMINYLFAFSIPLSFITFTLGLNQYSAIIGLSKPVGDAVSDWRISLFPSVTESAVFALVVFLVNLSRKPKGWPAICAAAVYFIAFSGIRTAFVALLVSLCVYFVASLKMGNVAVKAVFYGLLMLFVISILSENILLFAVGSVKNDFLRQVLFRMGSGDEVSGETIKQKAFRGLLWLEHARLFLSNPLIGVGTFDFKKMALGEIWEKYPTVGSEAYLTSILARFGLIVVPFLDFFRRTIRNAIAKRERLPLAMLASLCVISFSYGSVIVPYNFVFLLFLGALREPVREAETVTVDLRESGGRAKLGLA